MGHHSEAFIGIDTSKSRNAIAVADGSRGGEVRYLGEFPATDAAIRKLLTKLAEKFERLTFCYEAGPTGYGSTGCSRAWVTIARWLRPLSFRRNPVTG